MRLLEKGGSESKGARQVVEAKSPYLAGRFARTRTAVTLEEKAMMFRIRPLQAVAIHTV
jgi:hypothetical protein